MPAPHTASSASPVTSTFESYSSDGLNGSVLKSNTHPDCESVEPFLRRFNRTISRRFPQNISETQIDMPIRRTIFSFPTETFSPLMIAGLQSSQALLHTNSDHVHVVRTRRSTERCTARFFQGKPSLARSQTCQRHTPPTVPRR